MGNICGKSSKDDAFSQPGRVVGSAPPQNTTSSVPAQAQSQSRKVGGPARALGGGGGNGSSEAGGVDDARRKAAEAAEVSLFLS